MSNFHMILKVILTVFEAPLNMVKRIMAGTQTVDDPTNPGQNSGHGESYGSDKKFSFSQFDNVSMMSNTKSKKCQSAAGDRLDLIQTMPVPSRGLARPKKINRTKKIKTEKSKLLIGCHLGSEQ